MPELTPKKVSEMIDTALTALEVEENRKRVQNCIDEAKKAEPDDQVKRQLLMAKELMPLAQEIVGESWKDYGVTADNAQMMMMQVQMMAMMDPTLQPKAAKIMDMFQGKVS